MGLEEGGTDQLERHEDKRRTTSGRPTGRKKFCGWDLEQKEKLDRS